MSGPVVTIGGGSIAHPDSDSDTIEIDEYIVKLSSKKKPNVLFIPTASSDARTYIDAMHTQYAKRLGCTFETLCLLKNTCTKTELRSKIQSADIIYVGGGNTLKMMRKWRYLGVDALVKRAWKDGATMCGLSAGSICWYEYGHSDSMYYYRPDDWQYIRVKGLGLIEGIHCPHYDSDTDGVPRKDHFRSFMRKFSQVGIAVDNCCAVAYKDDTYKVLSCKKGAGAYKLKRVRGGVREESIERRDTYRPVEELHDMNKW